MARAIEDRDFQRVVQAGSLGRVAQLSHPTPEHFLPTLFSLGVAHAKDDLRFFNTSFDMASISMRSFVLA
jgi:4,5-DOPA dioxygenase extradiol